MFNSTYVRGGDVKNTFNINAVNGTIVKNYPKSFFKKFKLSSNMAETLFDAENPHLIKLVTKHREAYGSYRSSLPSITESYTVQEKVPVVILQMMMCGEDSVLAEIMYKEDFDSLFMIEEENNEV